MKTRIISIVVMLLMACNVMAQDYMTVYFKDGTDRKFYLKDIASIATKKLDAEGKQHDDYDFQHITTHHNKYVYNLNEVDSITFSSIDEEAAERNFVAAMPEVFTALSDCNTIEDAEKVIDQINAIDGVGDAWTDGHALYVLIEEGETYTFDFGHDALMVSDTTFLSHIRALAPKLKSKAELDNFTPSVVLVNQQARDEHRSYQEEVFTSLVNILQSCGIDAQFIANPSVGFFYDNSHDPAAKNIYDFDYILLLTHGVYGKLKTYENGKKKSLPACHMFITSEEIGTAISKDKDAEDVPDWYLNYHLFKDQRDNSDYYDATDQYITYQFSKELRGDQWKWIAYPALTEYFFRDYAQGLFKNNSILFNVACQSLKENNDMANIFREKRNLGYYLGYTESNYNGLYAGGNLLFNLSTGLSFEQSFNELPAWQKEETLQNYIDANLTYINEPENAKLLTIPENDEDLLGYFFNRPITLDVNASDANQEWIETGKVTATGVLSVCNIPREITTGIEYGLAPNNLDKRVSANMVAGPWNGQSYFKFDCNLTGLVGGNLYYYRAYSFDGLRYNYGETKDFMLKSGKIITLAQHELVLHSGNSGVVRIEDGSGDYSCTVNWGNIVSAEISGDELIVKSHEPGEAIVTVNDNGLGQATKLKVSVIYAGERCPDEHHPHMIDLGLPSGTLWSCSNVWTFSPEGYGNYYAWGELDEKSECVEDNYYYRNPMADSYSYLGTDIAGTSYDAAHMLWGDLWQMPSKEQFQELIDNCTWEHLVQNGVEGYRVISRNGASVFLPFAGRRSDDPRDHEGEYGGYWTSTWVSGSSWNSAWLLSLLPNDEPKIYDAVRYKGWSVRPVCTGLPSTVLRVDRNGVALNVGDRNSIVITSGSGNYSIHNSNEIALKASLENGTVAIEGLSGGIAVVTLTDITTKQSTDITVRVLGDEEPIQIETFTANGVSFNMVKVTGGTFTMGANSDDNTANSNEYPRHQVSLSNYSIGQTEVTQALWEAVMGTNPSGCTGSDQMPVDAVSWYECQDFIAKLNELTGQKFRLPTEAEWEYAARGGNLSNGYLYSGSNNIDDVAWHEGNSGETSHEVATKAPNELGIYDMSGNAFEMVQDWYSSYKSDAQANPSGPSSGSYKAGRGGSWYSNASSCRVSHRINYTPSSKYTNLGLRLALPSNTDERIDQVIPEEYLDMLEGHIPIYDGSTPPFIEGEYLVSPLILTFDVGNQYSPGDQFADLFIKLYNQDMIFNTIDYNEKQASSTGSGTGAFISGQGNNFTVFFNVESVIHLDVYDVMTKEAIVISGTKTSTGISNLYYSFVMIEKSDDPNHRIVDEGYYRVFKDQDGSSPYYNWYSSNAPERAPVYDWSLPGMLLNNPK